MTLLDTFPLTALPRRFLLASVTAFALLSSHAHAAEKLPVTLQLAAMALVVALGEWVLRQACRDAGWDQHGVIDHRRRVGRGAVHR